MPSRRWCAPVRSVDPAELADPDVLLMYLAGNATRDR